MCGALTLGVLEIRVAVNPSVAHIPISRTEDVSQLTGLEGAWHSTNEYGLACIYWLGVVHDVITVTQSPGSDLDLWLSHNC